MPTRPAEDVFRELMTPAEIARSNDKAEAMKAGAMKAGAMIARLREEAGMTRSELADRVGVTQQAVFKMEWGDDIKLPTLNRALAALGASLYIRTARGDVPLTTAAP